MTRAHLAEGQENWRFSHWHFALGLPRSSDWKVTKCGPSTWCVSMLIPDIISFNWYSNRDGSYLHGLFISRPTKFIFCLASTLSLALVGFCALTLWDFHAFNFCAFLLFFLLFTAAFIIVPNLIACLVELYEESSACDCPFFIYTSPGR